VSGPNTPLQRAPRRGSPCCRFDFKSAGVGLVATNTIGIEKISGRRIAIVRRTRLVALVVVIILLVSFIPASANQPINVIVNGRPITMDIPPVIRDGRTLAPLRAIFEALGASVEWDATTSTITSRRNDRTIILQIDNPTARVNNAPIALSVPPVVIGGRTMVPVRFIAESLGATVTWDEQTRTVTVQTDDAPVLTVRTIPAQVTSVTDGDTIVVRLESGKEERVRLIGVDTPESTGQVEPFGREAANFTRERVGGRSVFLEIDTSERDRFGRLLAYVWLAQPTIDNEAEVRAKMFNAELMLQGFANAMTVPPNVKYSALFLKFGQEARNAVRGLWAATAPIAGATSGVVIASVDLVGEVVTITNRSAQNVDVSGWVLQSVEGNQRFTFPSATVVAANASITVVSGTNAAAGPGRLLWTRSHIWNNAGDPAVLFDAAGREISRFPAR